MSKTDIKALMRLFYLLDQKAENNAQVLAGDEDAEWDAKKAYFDRETFLAGCWMLKISIKDIYAACDANIAQQIHRYGDALDLRYAVFGYDLGEYFGHRV